MRLIDADAIPYTMIYKENWLAGTGMEKQGAWKDDIDAMPTIEERKKGKWITVKGLETCSVCGESPDEDIYVEVSRYRWCPRCGARMTEGEGK